MSTKKSQCFDIVWRQPSSTRRQKQVSVQQSIVHLFKALTQPELREVWVKQRMAAMVSRGLWPSGSGGVGGYWSCCGHLWHLLGGLSVIREGKWGPSGTAFLCVTEQVDTSKTNRFTKSSTCFPITPTTETSFCFSLSYFCLFLLLFFFFVHFSPDSLPPSPHVKL